MLAKNEPIFQDAAETLYNLNSDETIRAQCRAREDYNRQQKIIKHHIKELRAENKHLISENQQLAAEKQQIAAEKQQITEKYDIATKKSNEFAAENQQLKKLLADHGIKYELPTNE
jgi:uncharacterized coiled-coil DUF342 family protein